MNTYVGRTTSVLPAGVSIGKGGGRLRRVNLYVLSGTITSLITLLVVASAFIAVVLSGCNLRYLPLHRPECAPAFDV